MTNTASRLRRIGILGGMGPAAAIDLQSRILEATHTFRDDAHVPVIVWNIPQVPDRVAAFRGLGPSPLPAMIEGVRGLQACGCEAFAVACNTAHHWADELAAAVRIPMLHIADAAIDALCRLPVSPRRVGLLATSATLEAGFYAERLGRRGLAWVTPSPDEQEKQIDIAIEAVKSGDAALARDSFEAAARTLARRGADVLVLACTELPIAARHARTPVALLDATRALAEAAVAFSRGA